MADNGAMARREHPEELSTIPAVRVGWLLARGRRLAGLRLGQVADHLGVPARTVRRWEAGGALPESSDLASLAALYEIDLSELIPARGGLRLYEGVLTVGNEQRAVRSNSEVLTSYVAMVRAQRGLGPGSPLTLRHDDVVALADALDLSDRDLEARLTAIAGVSPEQARWFRTQLLNRRLMVPLVTAAAAAGGLVIAMSGGPVDRPPVATVGAEHATPAGVSSAVGLQDPTLVPGFGSTTVAPGASLFVTTAPPVSSAVGAGTVAAGPNGTVPSTTTTRAVTTSPIVDTQVGQPLVIEAPTSSTLPAAMEPPIVAPTTAGATVHASGDADTASTSTASTATADTATASTVIEAE